MKNLNEKLLKLIIKLTPANDKLAHFYWGTIYALLGLVLASLMTIVLGPVKILAILPLLITAIPAYVKEKRDATGLGNSEKLDFVFTVIPSIPISILLYIILALS